MARAKRKVINAIVNSYNKPKKDIDGADNQLNKEEAASVGIDSNTFEELDTDNTGKLSDDELPQIFTDRSADETQLKGTINDPEEGMYAGSTLNKDMAGLLSQGTLPQAEAPFLGAETAEDGNIRLKLPEISGASLDLNTGIKETKDDKLPVNTPSRYEDAKRIIQSLGTPQAPKPMPVRDGKLVQGSVPESIPPSYGSRPGSPVQLPETGSATATGSKPLSRFNTGSMTRLFNDIMSGKHTSLNSVKVKGINGGGPIRASSSSSPIRLSSASQESLFDKITGIILRQYRKWPVQDGWYTKEKGGIALFVKDERIFIKFGSHRKTTIETFAKAHPEMLPRILETVQS